MQPVLTKTILQDVAKLLTSKRDMLEEYFAITIDASGLLSSMPILMPNHTPDLDALPLFILRLGTEVLSLYHLYAQS